MKCSNCGSEEIHTDSPRGSVYCGNCGMVQEEGFIVSTLQFDTVGSKSSMRGKMVNVENTNIGTQFADSSFYIRNTISSICSKLSLGSEHVDCAFRWYKLCLQYSLSKGKSILYTLSACVYISCRQESTPHLLIDFSNELRIDMFKIGRMFLKLRALLGVDIPLSDPSLYMHRFASQFKFNSREVLDYATRLVSRMKKDWITTGRRPNNTCGAAILIASRIFKEEKSIKEIATTVKASAAVIAKRLAEIAATESADLGIEEFKSVWLDEEQDPPIVSRRKRVQEQCPTPGDTVSEKSESICTEEDKESNFNVDDFVLDSEEIKNKERLWDSLYGDYVMEQAGKRKEKPKSMVVRKKRKHDFSTVEEAFMSLDKKVSTKLNYAAIESLFNPN